MKTYHVTLGYDVPFHHTVAVQARDAAEAEAKVLAADVDESLFEPAYDGSGETHVVDTVEITEHSYWRKP
jgi:hypothetical protein